MISALFQFYGYGRFGPFSQALVYLEQFGLLDSIIPFVLIFAILYSIILKANIFSPEAKLNQRVTIVVALSITLVTVIPHVLGLYPSPFADPVNIINNSLPQIALIVVAIVLALIMTNAMGTTLPESITSKAPWIALVLIGLVFYGALTPPGSLPGFLNFFADPFFYTIMIILAVFAGVIYLVVKD